MLEIGGKITQATMTFNDTTDSL